MKFVFGALLAAALSVKDVAGHVVGRAATSTSTGVVTSSPTPVMNTGKRGLAYNQVNLTQPFSLSGQNSQVSWAYNWNYKEWDMADFNSALEYVPMLWNNDAGVAKVWPTTAQAAIDSGSTALLSFNEPDWCGSGSSCMTVNASVTAYMNSMQPFAGKALLGAPAVTNVGGANYGLGWLEQFIGNCTSCQIDFICIHWYSNKWAGINYFQQQVEAARAIAGGRPIWVTEFGLDDSYTDADLQIFLQEAMTWMDAQPDVHRYAYFMDTPGYLITSDGSALSGDGILYNNFTDAATISSSTASSSTMSLTSKSSSSVTMISTSATSSLVSASTSSIGLTKTGSATSTISTISIPSISPSTVSVLSSVSVSSAGLVKPSSLATSSSQSVSLASKTTSLSSFPLSSSTKQASTSTSSTMKPSSSVSTSAITKTSSSSTVASTKSTSQSKTVTSTSSSTKPSSILSSSTKAISTAKAAASSTTKSSSSSTSTSASTTPTFTILSAYYADVNVTTAARTQLLQSSGTKIVIDSTNYFALDNGVDPWPGTVKTLSILYSLNGVTRVFVAPAKTGTYTITTSSFASSSIASGASIAAPAGSSAVDIIAMVWGAEQISTPSVYAAVYGFAAQGKSFDVNTALFGVDGFVGHYKVGVIWYMRGGVLKALVARGQHYVQF